MSWLTEIKPSEKEGKEALGVEKSLNDLQVLAQRRDLSGCTKDHWCGGDGLKLQKDRGRNFGRGICEIVMKKLFALTL